MYTLLDWFFTLLHVVIIGFNLTGWIWPSTRKLHFIFVLLTAGSWLILGIWFGLGYCPITDWQWQIKEQLGKPIFPIPLLNIMQIRYQVQMFPLD